MNKKISFSALAVAVMLLLASCSKDSVNKMDIPISTDKDTLVPSGLPIVSGDDKTDNSNTLLGNPTLAQKVSTYTTNYYIDLTYYAVSYNSTRGVSNWISWHLQSSDNGTAKRQDDFRPYTLLPSGWYQVNASSYNGSMTQFNRGHMCPSGDRTQTQTANSSTFYMINMAPQVGPMNGGPWGRLENVVRDSFVAKGNEAFIVAGSYGAGGTSLTGTVSTTYTTLDNGHVTVPSHIWKVAVIINSGNNDLQRIDSNATVIAVDMPNDANLYPTKGTEATNWRKYSTTINDIENNARSLGLDWDLLRNVRTGVKEYLKTKKYQ